MTIDERIQALTMNLERLSHESEKHDPRIAACYRPPNGTESIYAHLPASLRFTSGGLRASKAAKMSKNPAAVQLGRKGGAARVPKGFSALTPEQRSANAKTAALKRWRPNF